MRRVLHPRAQEHSPGFIYMFRRRYDISIRAVGPFSMLSRFYIDVRRFFQ